MGKYSIKDLEKLSGIKAHTLRIWEQRYGVLEPSRSESNIRFYSDEELKKILKVVLLNQSGIKISKIAQFTDQEIAAKVLELSKQDTHYNLHIDNLVIAMVEMDENKFESELSSCSERFGFETCFTQIVHPFFTKVGVLWLTGNINPIQEHLISNLTRQKLIVAIDNLKNTSTIKSKKFILFLPENEWHELGLLFYAYLVKKNGFRMFYLGQSVPLNDLKKVSDVHQPHYLMTSMLSYSSENGISDLLNLISKKFETNQILAMGKYPIEVTQNSPSNIKFIDSIQNFHSFLGQLNK